MFSRSNRKESGESRLPARGVAATVVASLAASALTFAVVRNETDVPAVTEVRPCSIDETFSASVSVRMEKDDVEDRIIDLVAEVNAFNTAEYPEYIPHIKRAVDFVDRDRGILVDPLRIEKPQNAEAFLCESSFPSDGQYLLVGYGVELLWASETFKNFPPHTAARTTND